MTAGWTEEEVFVIAERAFTLFVQGCYSESAILLEGILAIDPLHSYAATTLAAVYIAMGMPEAALQSIDAYLRHRSSDPVGIARRCEALIACGRRDEARREWRTNAALLRKYPAISECLT
jgi:predicted Zn-dependent protease